MTRTLNRIVGLTLSSRLDSVSTARRKKASDRALRHFPWLSRTEIEQNGTSLELWGHGNLNEMVHKDSRGNLLALVGSPQPVPDWVSVERTLDGISGPTEFRASWDGRFLLAKVASDGDGWTLWNDWCGAVPVFHARIGDGFIASTLEPVTVAAAGYTSDDFFIPGIVSLLLNGHYIADWTLFREMRTLQSDSVSIWNEDGFHWERLHSIWPSKDRWMVSWDELVAEMNAILRRAVIGVLSNGESWTLPLSGGLDSRIIAAIASEAGIPLRTITYGPATWNDPIYAAQVARALNLPWKGVDLGTEFFTKYLPTWADWFGSALHFHGMYQLSFLDSLLPGPGGGLIMGFLGDVLSGAGLTERMKVLANPSKVRPLGRDHRWKVEEISEMFNFPVKEHMEEYGRKVEAEIECLPGERFQKIMILPLTERQREFTYYQSMMYDYYFGVATPYLNREYVQFCLSLPMVALEGRSLALDMIKRCYPKVAEIGGTFGCVPLIPTRNWILRNGIACRLPRFMRVGPLREFNTTPNTMEPYCFRSQGKKAAWPVLTMRDKLSTMFKIEVIDDVVKAALKGEWPAIDNLETIQPIALRMMGEVEY